MEYYIYKKDVDWSLLHEGFSIPVSIQVIFHDKIKKHLCRGERNEITFLVDGIKYPVILTNISFDKDKYPGHKDLLQIRYSPSSAFADKLRNTFTYSFALLKSMRENATERKRQKVPNENREYMTLYAAEDSTTFIVDYITATEHNDITSLISEANVNEEEYESSIDLNRLDNNASIKIEQRLIKIRKLNRLIGDSLKAHYDYRCQICGGAFKRKYGINIAESHHIIPFVESLNNNTNNLLIVCPNHHRIIHAARPRFNMKEKAFEYPNGVVEHLRINTHI